MEEQRFNVEQILESILEGKKLPTPREKEHWETLIKCEISRFELYRVIEMLANQYDLDFDTLKERFQEAAGMIDNPLPLEVFTERCETIKLLILDSHPVVRLLEELKKEHAAKLD